MSPSDSIRIGEARTARFGRALMLFAAAAMFIGLAVLAFRVVRSAGHVGPMPWMVVLFAELTIAAGVFLALDGLRTCAPRAIVFQRLQRSVSHHLTLLGIVTFAIIALAVAVGIGYALGII